MALGLGGHAIAAGDFANLHAAVVGGIGGDQLVDQLAQDGLDLTVALTGGALRLTFGVLAGVSASGASEPGLDDSSFCRGRSGFRVGVGRGLYVEFSSSMAGSSGGMTA